MNGFLKDTDGNKSSKRLAGVCLLITGGAFLLALGITAIYKIVADPTTALAVGKTLIYTGAGLLGVGVAEGIGQSIRRNGGGK